MNSRRGQAMTELAITMPVLILMMVGVVDLGRSMYLTVEMSGAARAGVMAGIQGTSWDIGDYVRSEPATAIPDDSATWGQTGPGGANADCTSGSQHCGDPNGCSLTLSTWTSGQAACFAIRTCTLSSGDYGSCSSYGAWGTRPTSSSAKGLVVVVVYRFTVLTPIIQGILLPADRPYIALKQTIVGDASYV